MAEWGYRGEDHLVLAAAALHIGINQFLHDCLSIICQPSFVGLNDQSPFAIHQAQPFIRLLFVQRSKQRRGPSKWQAARYIGALLARNESQPRLTSGPVRLRLRYNCHKLLSALSGATYTSRQRAFCVKYGYILAKLELMDFIMDIMRDANCSMIDVYCYQSHTAQITSFIFHTCHFAVT